jgi:signal transduction histidine kinase
MITIVDELLDLARIEARRGKDFVIEDIHLQDLVAGIVRDFKPPEQRPGPLMGPDPGALWVRADRSKTIQAIVNVLSNAYKYSPAGGDVRLQLVRREAADGDSGPQAGIELEDQGLGMTPEQLARIGERFYRADTSGRIPGTGLGMSIVKEVMALQGGSLDLHSEHGRGTRVRLWLPALACVPDTDAAVLAGV